MAFDPTRLYTALLNTGLQIKDNPLYQVIYQLITALSKLTGSVDTIINTPTTPVINNFQTIIQDYSNDISNAGDSWPIAISSGSGSGRTAAQVTASVSLGI